MSIIMTSVQHVNNIVTYLFLILMIVDLDNTLDLRDKK